jgi:hypothetical protein
MNNKQYQGPALNGEEDASKVYWSTVGVLILVALITVGVLRDPDPDEREFVQLKDGTVCRVENRKEIYCRAKPAENFKESNPTIVK